MYRNILFMHYAYNMCRYEIDFDDTDFRRSDRWKTRRKRHKYSTAAAVRDRVELSKTAATANILYDIY